MIAGGWNRVDPNSPDIREDALFAIAAGNGRLAEVELAETQVVAGINVRMIVRLADGRRERVTVWRRLDGTRQLTDVEPLPGG
ncbi:hypothetical protein [Novosphingobium sp. KCTC 2891]|uniref:hypothetical protein n=1 Tax=Novosphingobium sp. KCTC 2891 TaxID=2989730 RepID=UPI002221F8FE|nr:hypothetical protein [Novosphingobium sp. KCTC 2891]